MKGSYILVISIAENIKISIGALGEIFFEKGFYFYIGSGMGETGSSTLEKRVNRHILPSTKKRFHWHIDYLLNHKFSSIIRIYLLPSLYRLECIIAKEITNYSDSSVINFGSSDCNCPSHLLYFREISNFML